MAKLRRGDTGAPAGFPARPTSCTANAAVPDTRYRSWRASVGNLIYDEDDDDDYDDGDDDDDDDDGDDDDDDDGDDDANSKPKSYDKGLNRAQRLAARQGRGNAF
jgi:hypothetical protein